jgi:aminocarboxymuconate-semialdehyde decarboxylase
VTAIDIHFHVTPRLLFDAVRDGKLREVVEIKTVEGVDRLLFHAPPDVVIEPNITIRPSSYDTASILKAMDERKLDAAAISAPPELFLYWVPPDMGERLARLMNDGYAEMARAYPGRFLPLATVPLQDPPRAARELERAVTQAGLRGVSLCTHVNGRDLDDPANAPLFAMAERLDVPVFLHPQNAGDITRLKDYHLWNAVGFPLETVTAASRLIASGAFERWPGLKVILAHGGGFFPYQIGRLDHAYAANPSAFKGLPKKPSAYIGNIYCDSLTHSALSLRFLIDRFGYQNVVLGSDYPFLMRSDTLVDEVVALGLPADEKKAILGGTLSRLLKAG